VGEGAQLCRAARCRCHHHHHHHHPAIASVTCLMTRRDTAQVVRGCSRPATRARRWLAAIALLVLARSCAVRAALDATARSAMRWERPSRSSRAAPAATTGAECPASPLPAPPTPPPPPRPAPRRHHLSPRTRARWRVTAARCRRHQCPWSQRRLVPGPTSLWTWPSPQVARVRVTSRCRSPQRRRRCASPPQPRRRKRRRGRPSASPA
jgi:hypothetical protein